MLGRKAKVAAEPPPAESWQERRRKEVLSDIHRLEGEMASLDLRMRLFREKNFATINGRLVWRLGGFAELPVAQAELLALEKERDDLLTQWHKILHEHASLVSPRR